MTERSPRVLHVIETLDIGGAEAVLVDLVGATREACEPLVCCLKHRGALADRLDARVRVLCLDTGEGVNATRPWRLAALIREHRIDVVHSHLWGSFLDAALAARLAGVPVIHTVHGLYPRRSDGAPARLKRAFRHWAERRVARWHRRIVAVSGSIEQQLRGPMRLDGARVETVHNGIGRRAIDPTRRRGATFISVGRLAAVKNQAMMLRAFATVATERPEARLQLVGDGPERASLEALVADLRIADRVEFLGFRADVGELLDAADVFLMSSRYEGVSIAILEAMRSALPVVATRVGGIPETVDPACALLVEDGDEAAFASAMRELLVNRERRVELGRAAARRQAERFSLEAAATRYLRFYAASAA